MNKKLKIINLLLILITMICVFGCSKEGNLIDVSKTNSKELLQEQENKENDIKILQTQGKEMINHVLEVNDLMTKNNKNLELKSEVAYEDFENSFGVKNDFFIGKIEECKTDQGKDLYMEITTKYYDYFNYIKKVSKGDYLAMDNMEECVTELSKIMEEINKLQ